MYTDHKKGFNDELSDTARTQLLMNKISQIPIISRSFDEYGDVKRNYKEELELYAKNEEELLLPQVSSEYFYSFQVFKNFRDEQEKEDVKAKKEKFTYKVIPVPQLPRTKPQMPSPALTARFKALFTVSQIPKLSFILKSLF